MAKASRMKQPPIFKKARLILELVTHSPWKLLHGRLGPGWKYWSLAVMPGAVWKVVRNLVVDVTGMNYVRGRMFPAGQNLVPCHVAPLTLP